MDISKQKKDMRRMLKQRRDQLAPRYLTDATSSICSIASDWFEANLALNLAGTPKPNVFAYLKTGSEVDLMPLLVKIAVNVSIGIPRIVNSTTMEFRRWSPGDPVSLNRFSISEPIFTAPHLSVDKNTVILVPALAADSYGFRLGYGGGFYDRYLSNAPACTKIAVLFASMLTDELSREPHDIPCDYLLTEDGLIPALK